MGLLISAFFHHQTSCILSFSGTFFFVFFLISASHVFFYASVLLIFQTTDFRVRFSIIFMSSLMVIRLCHQVFFCLLALVSWCPHLGSFVSVSRFPISLVSTIFLLQ